MEELDSFIDQDMGQKSKWPNAQVWWLDNQIGYNNL